MNATDPYANESLHPLAEEALHRWFKAEPEKKLSPRDLVWLNERFRMLRVADTEEIHWASRSIMKAFGFLCGSGADRVSAEALAVLFFGTLGQQVLAANADAITDYRELVKKEKSSRWATLAGTMAGPACAPPVPRRPKGDGLTIRQLRLPRRFC